MEGSSEDLSNRESYQKFGENDPTDNNKIKESKSFPMKKICIITLSTLIFIVIIIIAIIFLTKEKLKCEPGYYLPDDDSSQCLKCSEENCFKCKGTKDSNLCEVCYLGYKLENSKCEINHSIKAIYKTDIDYEVINLMHFIIIQHVSEMIVDNEKVNPDEEYNFTTAGNHTIYYLINTSDLESLGEMFYGVENLISVSFTHLFDTKNITWFSNMFYGCKELTSIDLSYLNTENAIYLTGMFQQCSSLKSIDLSNFNTQNVTSMSTMFYGCNSLKKLDISNFNTQELTSMSSMFYGCYNLTELNLNNFDTKYVTSMSYLFHRCYSLTSINLSNFNIENAKFMEGMFQDCHSLTSINISHFNTENITKIDYMFYGCNNLIYLDISNFHYDKNVSLFYDLPDNGKLFVNKDFINIIEKQIPSSWDINIIDLNNIDI